MFIFVKYLSATPMRHIALHRKTLEDNKTMPKKDRFKKILVEAIDEGLNELGESARKAIYFYLKENFQITRQNFCNDLQKFSRGLRSIFGEGAKIIERLILQVLFKKVGYTPENGWEQLSFEENIRRVKEYLEKS